MEEKKCKFCGHVQISDEWSDQLRFTKDEESGKFFYTKDDAEFTQCPECFNFIDLEYDILMPETGMNSK